MKMNMKLRFATSCLGLLCAPALAINAQTPVQNWSPETGPSQFQSLRITSSPVGDAGSAGDPVSSPISKPQRTNPAIAGFDKQSITAAPSGTLQVSPNVDVAFLPSIATLYKRETHTASLLTHATPPPSKPVSEEADHFLRAQDAALPIGYTPSTQPVIEQARPVQTAQVETVEMSKPPNMTPNDPPDMMKDKLAYDSWASLLGKYTAQSDDGLVRFDYAGLQASAEDTQALDDYIDELAAKKPSTFTREQSMVYWANLYNAITVKIVAEKYPVSSIRKIKSGLWPGPWKKDVVTVEGETLSLDNIEHGIMRPTFQTPLVHYMVNCASIGCPNLKQTPWQVETLEADLDAAARAFINSPRGAMIDKGRLKVSSIYKWFSKDFGSNHPEIIAHLSKYADDDLSPKLIGRKKIDKYGYDWGVNAP